MSSRAYSAAVALVMFGASARIGGAQERVLPDRFSAPTRAAIERVIDSARVRGVPRGPLVDKALEGVLKGADDDRILRAVRSLARELVDARSALATSDATTLGAGASALHAGVAVDELRQLAQSAASSEPAVLPAALVTLVDLVAKQVPVPLATSSIRTMLEKRATERQFAELRMDVERQMLSGRTAEAALAARMRAHIDARTP
jgi:hypothetical protein